MSELVLSPKTFISYSWTTPEHEQWVVDLASELESANVHVVLDKWDLREGQDANKFMEQMVTDPDVKKVILVCDREYTRKANSRTGGAGTEAQIISPELYGKVEQTKFAAIVTEFDDTNEPCVPAFYKGRIHIDMSSPDKRNANLEQLLRWIYDKPMHARPPRGRAPAFLSDGSKIELTTGASFRLAMSALREDRRGAGVVFRRFLEEFADELNAFQVTEVPPGTELDDLVVDRLEALLPYRDQLLDVVFAAIDYRDEDETFATLGQFLERLLRYHFQPAGANLATTEHLEFFIHEFVLYLFAVLLRRERFGRAKQMMERGYYLDASGLYNTPDDRLLSFTRFRSYYETLERRNRRLSLRQLDLTAEFFKKRATRSDVTLNHLMQADFVLFLRGILHGSDYRSWYPHTLIFLNYYNGPFEIFLRSRSARYFKPVLDMLDVADKDRFVTLVTKEVVEKKDPSVWWQGRGFNALSLIGADNLGTLP